MDGRLISLQDGLRIWLAEIPGGPGLPLLVLHGGPGAAHDYLEPLSALSASRPVVFYDQLGCGRSDQPDDPALYTMARAAADLAEVRQAAGLRRCHVLGQSAGGMLALEHLSAGADGVESLTLASVPVSIPALVADLADHLDSLPDPAKTVIRQHLAAGRHDTPEFDAAMMEFYTRFLCRLAVWPDCALRSAAWQAASPAYAVMGGAHDLALTGNIRDWDRSAGLSGLPMPVLVTHGRHDYIVPRGLALLRAGLKRARFVEFARSAHVAHLEEPEAFIRVLEDFLAEVDAGKWSGDAR